MEQRPIQVRRRSDRYLHEQETSAPLPVQDPAAPVQVPAAQDRAAGAPVSRPQQPSPYAPQRTAQPPRQQSRPQGQQPPRRNAYPEEETWASAPKRKPVQRPCPPTGESARRSGPIERSAPAKKMLQSGTPGQGSKKPKEYRRPVWMTALMVIGLLLILACFTAEMLMNAYLKTQADERERAQQRIVTAHPIQYEDLIRRYAAQYNLQPAFVTAIILNESSFNTRAESSVGARGLMQLMPDTAEWIAHKLGMDAVWDVDLLWDAETNIRFGCWYLNYLSEMFGGDPVTVASAYHTGQGKVQSWLSNAEYAPDGKALSLTGMPEGPTRTYAGRVIRDYGIYDRLYYFVFNPREAGSV